MSQQFYDCRELPEDYNNINKKEYKKVKDRFVCLNCKTGGGPRVGNKGYVNFGAWYNHCYSIRDKNCKFDNI